MNADLIKKLRATTYLADPYAVMAKAATALEASDKREADLIAKIANLELELANCKTSRQRAREDILRALDKRLSEDK